MTHPPTSKSSATRHDDPLVLTGVFGDFELADLVGRDGPFSLYRARQISLDRPVTPSRPASVWHSRPKMSSCSSKSTCSIAVAANGARC